MSKYTPIGIVTYSRINHLKQVVEALQKNTLANKTDLFLFIDGPKKGDEEKVKIVSDYCETVTGFNQVYVVKREKNIFPLNHAYGRLQMLSDYGKAILFEDDIIAAPGFLQFMNDALNKYENDERVFSVSGHLRPVRNFVEKTDFDSFSNKGGPTWGFGTWKNRWDKFIDFDKNHLKNNLKKDLKLKSFRQYYKYSPMGLETLKEISRGEHWATDFKIKYFFKKFELYDIRPTFSLVRNIGFDGSGLHTNRSNTMGKQEIWDKVDNFRFPDDPTFEDPRITKFRMENKAKAIKGAKLFKEWGKVYAYRLLKRLNLYNFVRKFI